MNYQDKFCDFLLFYFSLLSIKNVFYRFLKVLQAFVWIKQRIFRICSLRSNNMTLWLSSILKTKQINTKSAKWFAQKQLNTHGFNLFSVWPSRLLLRHVPQSSELLTDCWCQTDSREWCPADMPPGRPHPQNSWSDSEMHGGFLQTEIKKKLSNVVHTQL